MQNTGQKVNLTALAVFITSAVGGGMLLSAALAVGAGALFLLVGKTNLDEAQTLASMGAGLFILGLLCIPGLVLAFLELDHRPLPQLKKLHFNTIWLIPILVVALIATLLLGFFSTGSVMGVLLMPLAILHCAGAADLLVIGRHAQNGNTLSHAPVGQPQCQFNCRHAHRLYARNIIAGRRPGAFNCLV